VSGVYPSVPLFFITIIGVLTLAMLSEGEAPAWRLATPLAFGVLVLVIWQLVCVGYGVPTVLLPPPTAIATAIGRHLPTLGADFRQTVLRSVLPGWAIGCGAGLLGAIAIDSSPFLRRGILPLGSLVSAMPIVGIAPIMVMWFGFDWQSKAAVVVAMTFFPMLVNATAGLESTGVMERDLMRSYAAGYWPTLLKLRLPAALPFVFNALKLNSTLALIGAIVAEFFGTPIVGMGFRISTEVARMNLDVVWAEITLAAVVGSASFAALALVERTVTFWHPSFRK
jgi:NitT/TauT family transport system permease protein